MHFVDEMCASPTFRKYELHVGIHKEAIPFIRNIAVRETFVSLSEWNFAWVPPPVAEVLTCTFAGLGQSAINEDANNKCQDHERDTKHKRMSRLSRFMWPCGGGLQAVLPS